MRLASIVEGHGEVDAVPVLLRRIAHDLEMYDLEILPPIRVQRGHFHAGSPRLHQAALLAACRVGRHGGVLVLFDADDDCSAHCGPALQSDLAARLSPLPVAVVLAHKEFETWFLAAVESLRGCRGIREDATVPPDPEAIRGSKEYLRRQMQPPRDYRETVDPSCPGQPDGSCSCAPEKPVLR
ncbi:DUF4276 family protein [Thermaerobacter subterraneus]|uniref:DUF4276 family protein n=1 Tax=Thermaerobacter subterraneus DSM 13965 TaxID=867903 RepID=K6PZT7_9FIRM|nr:hypothetical protein ThesuDRAFT_02061 [Thermaerobacter subterraneus DSM 13965]